jgi:hypothetical protein
MDVYGHLYPESQEAIAAAIDDLHEGPSLAIDLAARRADSS